jgi:two-component sensor histidine kinase
MKFILTYCPWVFALLMQIQSGLAQPMAPDSLFQSARMAKSYSEKVRSLTTLSKWNLGNNYPVAMAYADSALSIARTSADEKLEADALTIRALVYWHNGEYDSSVSAYQLSLDLQRNLGNTEEMGVNLHGIAMNYYYKADYKDALRFHQQALECFRTSANKTKQALVLNHIGLVHRRMGDYPKAIEYLFECSRIQQELPGYSGRVNSFTGQSPYSKLREYWERELAKQLSDLEKEQKSGRGRNILELLYNVADSYSELDDQLNGLEFYKRARDYSLSIGKHPDYFRLGLMYRKAGKIDSAILTHQLGLQQARMYGTKINIMWAHSLLGQDLFAAGRYKEALGYYQAALSMTSDMGNKLHVVTTLQDLADVYSGMGESREALAVILESIALAKKIDAMEQLMDGHLKAALVLAALGDSNRAFINQLRGKELTDSLASGEAELNLAQLQVQHESDRKSEDILRLNQEKLIQEAKIRNKDLLIIASAVVLCLSVLLAISSFRRYRQKSEANQILQQQNEHIEMLLAEIHHRVKNNLQVISSLLSIQSQQLKSRSARMAVLEGQSRVHAMGLIHENIYKGESFAFIQMDDYLQKLRDTALKSFGIKKGKVEVSVDASGLSVDVDTAIPLGLMINELLTNSLKHAFKTILNARVHVHLYLDNANRLNLNVDDNGMGMSTIEPNDSFGLRLVKELTYQMGGTFELINDQGFGVRIMITKFKLAA